MKGNHRWFDHYNAIASTTTPESRLLTSQHPVCIPINAIISGPTVGGPMPKGSQSPLAVSVEFYEGICSGPGVTHPELCIHTT